MGKSKRRVYHYYYYLSTIIILQRTFSFFFTYLYFFAFIYVFFITIIIHYRINVSLSTNFNLVMKMILMMGESRCFNFTYRVFLFHFCYPCGTEIKYARYIREYHNQSRLTYTKKRKKQKSDEISRWDVSWLNVLFGGRVGRRVGYCYWWWWWWTCTALLQFLYFFDFNRGEC